MAQVSEKQISKIIRRTVVESVRDVLSDPDYGLELTAAAKRRLKNFSLDSGHKGRTLDQIKKKYL